jgi:hypothetical protein
LSLAVDQFNRDGYLITGLLSDGEVRDILGSFATVFDQALRSMGADEMLAATLDEKYLFLEQRAPALKSHCYDLLGRVDRVAAGFAKAAAHDLAEQLGYAPFFFDDFHVRVCTNDNTRLQAVHQDLGHISSRMLTLWIPLVDIDDVCGGMVVCPGSHRLGRLRHEHTVDEFGHPQHQVRPDQLPAMANPVHLQLHRGSVVAFDSHLVHASAPNHSNAIRWTLIARLNQIAATPYLVDATATEIRMRQHIEEDDVPAIAPA